MLGLTFRIRAVQCLRLVFHGDAGRSAAHRTGRRDILYPAAGQVFRYLGNDHVRLVHGDPVSDPQLQFFHDTDVVDAGAAHCRPFQFHGLKDGHRVDQPCPGRVPLDFLKRGLPDFIRPLERKGISGELCRCPKRLTVSDVVIHEHQSIRRHFVFSDL